MRSSYRFGPAWLIPLYFPVQESSTDTDTDTITDTVTDTHIDTDTDTPKMKMTSKIMTTSKMKVT